MEKLIRYTMGGWKDDIKMDLGEIRLSSVDWIHVTLDMDRWFLKNNSMELISELEILICTVLFL
jgi:hypothetical protein